MIYIDRDTFKCHVEQNADETRIPYEGDFFDGKCQTFIEGYCCIPKGYALPDSDGTVYRGETVYPWRDYSLLAAAQREYELEKLAEYEALIDELYAEVTA